MSRLIVGAVLVVVLLAFAACGASQCTTNVPPGEVAVVTEKFSGRGVSPQPLETGFHVLGLGEDPILFPVVPRTYTFTQAPDERGTENEEISFTDKNGQVMTADIKIVLHPVKSRVPGLFSTYRYRADPGATFDHLLMNNIYNDVRTLISAETEKVGVEQLLQGGRQVVLQRSLVRLQSIWKPQGIEITQLDWIGAIRFPPTVAASIVARTQADQQVLAAQAQLAVANANAETVIANARGSSEAIRLRAAALRESPAVVDEIYARRSAGLCPPRATTCIIGAGAWGLAPEGNKNTYE